MREIRIDASDLQGVAEQVEDGFHQVLDAVVRRKEMTPQAMDMVMSYVVSGLAGRYAASVGPKAAAALFQSFADALRDEVQKASERTH